MGQDYGVNLSHKADGFGQGHNDLLIMVKVFIAEGPALAVFKPFVADLIAPEVERLQAGYFQKVRKS
jgi:hypothetical protein